MPIEGIPDREKHRLRFRCHKWHDPSEGDMVTPESSRPLGWIFQAAREISGLEGEQRFICRRCKRVRRVTKLAIWGLLAALLVLVLVLDWLKVI